jgi:intracellular multiplication protein IcmD
MKIVQKKKVTVYVSLIFGLLFFCGSSFAVMTLGDIATNMTGQFASVAKLITAASYVGGVAFCISAIFKLKQHKDNPVQNPLSTGIVFFVVGILLIFLPTVIELAAQSTFGVSSSSQINAGGVGGGGACKLPGANC